jgi:hypothetical protein
MKIGQALKNLMSKAKDTETQSNAWNEEDREYVMKIREGLDSFDYQPEPEGYNLIHRKE